MKPKKVLVTGVAGMLGSHFLDEILKKDYTVVGIDNLSFGKIDNIVHNLTNPRFRFFNIDVRDFEALKLVSEEVDIIVHFAAYKKICEKERSIQLVEINGNGTENIFKIAKSWGSKVIFASTSDVYGMSENLPLSEDCDLLIGPSMIKRWSYAVSKLYGEQMAYAYYNDFGVPIVINRYFGGFSERSNFKWSGGHIPIFIRAILNNEEVIIHGDGSQTRSMGYVKDLVNGTILAMENENAVGEIINIGNNEELSVLETANLIHSIADTGFKLKLRFVPFHKVFGGYKDITRRVPDLAKAKRLIGYEPKVKLIEAIKITINSVLENQKELCDS